MPSPFPGMDAYLENSELWFEVHSILIVATADIIAIPLRPNYLAKDAAWANMLLQEKGWKK